MGPFTTVRRGIVLLTLPIILENVHAPLKSMVFESHFVESELLLLAQAGNQAPNSLRLQWLGSA